MLHIFKFLTHCGFRNVTELHNTRTTVLVRAERVSSDSSDGEKVVIKILRSEFTSSYMENEMRREFATGKRLFSNGAHVLDPELLENGNFVAILWKDHGERTLHEACDLSLQEPREFVLFAKKVLEAVISCHKSILVHCDINPQNLLLSADGERVYLVDFTLSFFWRPNRAPPTHLLGHPGYMSPEATGLVNHPVDQRSDVYSLGCTFFYFLTGREVFADSTNLTNAHLSKAPPDICTLNPKVPPNLAAIISKMLAKSPMDRYQSLVSVLHDILNIDASPVQFHSGSRDFVTFPSAPTQMVGRDRELRNVMSALGSTAKSSPRAQVHMVSISGISGCGKSTLCSEAMRLCKTRTGVAVCSGKFEIGSFGERPFAAVCDALNDLVGQHLKRMSVAKVTELVAAHVQPQMLCRLVELVPKLAALATSSPVTRGKRRSVVPALEVDPDIHAGISQLLLALTPANGALVLCLDDMQWAGADTINLVVAMCMELRSRLLLVTLYRDNEVGPSHPWHVALAKIKSADRPLTEVHLNCLEKGPATELVAECLSCSAADVESFGELVWSRTGGNPFLVVELITYCYTNGILHFDMGETRWAYDAEMMRSAKWTESCANIVALGLQGQSPAMVRIIGLAACVGNQTDVATLAVVAAEPEEAVTATLGRCLLQGYMMFDASCEPAVFRFTHDKIADAAYATIRSDERQSVHSVIGARLLGKLADVPHESIKTAELLQVLLQLNRGSPPGDAPTQLKHADLNLEAARRSWRSGSESATRLYSETALRLLDASGRQWHDELLGTTLELHLLLGSALYALGDLAGASDIVASALTHAVELYDQVKLHKLSLKILASRGDHLGVIDLGLKICHVLGVDIPRNPDASEIDRELAALRAKVAECGVDFYLHLEDCGDWQKSAVISAALDMIPAAWMTGHASLHSLLPPVALNLIGKYGLTASSGEALSCAAITLLKLNGPAEPLIEPLGRIGVALARARNDPEVTGRAIYFRAMTSAVDMPYAKGSEQFAEAYSFFINRGNTFWAGLAIGFEASLATMAGERLELGLARLQRFTNSIEKKVEKIGVAAPLYAHSYSSTIMGSAVPINSILVGRLADKFMRDFGSTGIGILRFAALTFVAKAHYIMKHDELALRFIEASGLLFSAVVSNYAFTFEWWFWAALVYLRARRQQFEHGAGSDTEWCESDEWLARRKTVEEAREKLALCCSVCPENYEVRKLLLEADYAWTMEGPSLKVLQSLEVVIAKARDSFANDLAGVAAEQAYHVSTALKLDVGALSYRNEASAFYRRFGALSKCYFLTERLQTPTSSYEQEHSRGQMASNSKSTDSYHLEMMTMASQLTMGETDPGRLVELASRLLSEASGATHGHLFLMVRGQLQLASKWVGSSAEHFAIADSGDKAPSLSELEGLVSTKMVERVQVTRLAEYLPNASTVADVDAEDAFLSQGAAKRQLRSVLAMPWSQDGALGVIFLENRMMPGAFVDSTRGLLQMIANHFAVVLENVFLLGRVTGQLKAEEDANRALVEMASLKDQLLANVSHELRTPINGIIGTCALLASSKLDADQRFLTKTIEACSSGMLVIVEDILTSSQLKNNAVRLFPDDVSLDTIAHDVARVIACTADLNKLNFSVLLRLPRGRNDQIYVDRKSVQQITLNLLTNAVKFTATKGGSVSLRIECGEDGHGVRFEIVDTGIGMSQKTLDSIWEPFYQGDASYKRKYAGTGLGLTICKQLLSLVCSESKITVESEVGVGTRFWFELPLAVTGPPLVEPGVLEGTLCVIWSDCDATRESLAHDLMSLGSAQVLAIDSVAKLHEVLIAAVHCKTKLRRMLIVVDVAPSTTVEVASSRALEVVAAAQTVSKRIRGGLSFCVLHLCTSGMMLELKSSLLDTTARMDVLEFVPKPFFGSEVAELAHRLSLEDPPCEGLHIIAAQAPMTPRPVAAASPLESLRGRKLLIVDDNTVNLMILQRFLKLGDVEVVTATNGEMALEKYFEAPEAFDMILMDCQMPVMDGFEAAKEIRRRELELWDKGLSMTRRHVHIIACTAGAQAPEIEACYESGMCEVLLKPVNQVALYATVRTGLRASYPRCSGRMS